MTTSRVDSLAPLAPPLQARARGARPLAVAAIFVALLASAPLIAVVASLAQPFGETIAHVAATIGAGYALGTLALMSATGVLATLIGVGGALAVTLAEFPGRRFFSMALAAPLAVPAYVAAYAYGDFFSPFGAFARLAGGASIDIRSFWGAVFVLTMTLYPYVYLAARAAFEARSGAYLEAARLAGVSPLRAAVGLIAPSARPAIAGGALLVMMEAAADFGVADHFGVATLSIGVFRTWNAFGDLTAAAQLSSILVLIAIILVALDTAGRGAAHEGARGGRRRRRLKAQGAAALGPALFCGAPVFFGAFIPIAVIASKLTDGAAMRGLVEALRNTAAAATAGAGLIVLAALLLAYASRAAKGPVFSAVLRVATLGYAVPGAVIAIGVFSAGAFVFGGAVALATGFAALLYAYFTRFMTAGLNVVSGGLQGVAGALDGAARVLGAGGARIAARIHAPLMAPSLAAAAIILFVDIAKELPATLILRAFNFETLATRVYRLASDERLAEAAPAALTLIGLGVLPVILLSVVSKRR
jgi:iron(III) transport system permease protein